MKTRKPSFKKLEKIIERIYKDSKLMKEARKFVSHLGSKA